MTEEDKSLPLSGNFMTIDGRICKIENHFDQDDFVEGEKGEIFIKHTALVRVAKTLFSIIEYNAKVLQFPQKENEWSATVSTTFVVEPLVNQNFPFDFGLAQIKKYIWTACADCNRSNAMPG
ncbi:MAG: hypothetical protein GWN01_13265, partial [Nitrosopumilaceae archaeon]|nr:hypothetical protein [Nitrosopumilaceae archaeon]NIU88247.1 hypothetical protein [Nitrosopumilaceae archaeon]NIV66547.1 hypothetical protein [Nitrosopumilaceae archaeon]NIX62435.1 hypothetical protein [Nitrosopumilaceae archaeon]